MKILYTFGYFLHEHGAHVIHALKMCNAFQKAGHEVRLLAPLRELTISQTSTYLPKWVVPVKWHRGPCGLSLQIRRAVAEETLQWKPDILYVRPAIKDSLALHWLAGKQIPFFVEINTLTFHEQRLVRSFPRAILADVVECWKVHHSKGAICMTEEIARSIRSKVKKIPISVTGNGFDPGDIGLAAFNPSVRRQNNTPDNAKVILFTGSLLPWAGLDLLIPVIRTMPNVYLWIIGDGAEKRYLQELANRLGMVSRIRWVNWVKSPDIEPFYAAADVAIGPLALKRKKMKEAQPMKVRSYLGVGLPVLIGYHDTRVSGNWYWVKKANAYDSGELKRAIQELLSLPTRSIVLRLQIRQDAIASLSWDIIAAETIYFIQNCLRT